MHRPAIRSFLTDVFARAMARRAFARVNFVLMSASQRALGVLNWRSARVSGEEWLLRRLAALWPSPTILDVGANVGSWSTMARRLIPGSRVLALEPGPAFGRLQQAAAGTGFQAWNVGAAAEAGIATLYDYATRFDGSGHGTLFPEVFESLYHGESRAMTVDLTTLDTFAAEQRLERIHLLKIDVEGSEANVLRGASALIAAGKIDVVQFEFNEMNVVSRTFMLDFIRLLPGYDFYRLLPASALPMGEYRPRTWEIFAFQNIVCVRRGSEVSL